MSYYQPNYTITDQILGLTAEIAELVGMIEARHLQETSPLLRLGAPSEPDGAGPALYRAMSLLEGIDLFSMYDMKQTSGRLLHGDGAETGAFRQLDGGVSAGDRLLLRAPPAQLVPSLLRDLLAWMKGSTGHVHPLISAAVFHYELLYIQPFAADNPQLAQLWHCAILAQWKPVFSCLPLLLPPAPSREAYDRAIEACRDGESATPFIAFSLERIAPALRRLLPGAAPEQPSLSKYVLRLLEVTQTKVPYSATQLLTLLHLKSRETLRRNYLDPALALGLFRMEFPQTPRSKNQRYIKE